MNIANGFYYDWADPSPAKYSINIAQTDDPEAGISKPLAMIVEFSEVSLDKDISQDPQAITNDINIVIETLISFDEESTSNLDYQITGSKIIQDLKKQFNREQNNNWMDPVTGECTALSGIYVGSEVEPFGTSMGSMRVLTTFTIRYRQDRTDPGELR